MELVSAHSRPLADQHSAGQRTSSQDQPLVYVAGFWQRAAAGLLDALILSPLFLLLGWVAFHLAGASAPLGPGGRVENILELLLDGGSWLYGVLLMWALLAVFYGFFFSVISGATVGQRWCGLRVIDPYGETPSWPRCLLRAAGLLINCLLLGLGFVWTSVDPHKRSLHDHLAGTYVIRRRPAISEEDAA